MATPRRSSASITDGCSGSTASCAVFPGKESYPEDFKERPGIEHGRRFHATSATAGCISSASIQNAESLIDYLGAVKEYLDVICDQSGEEMRIVSGSQEYSIRANWKLLTENSVDGYHAVTTHATYLDYLKNTSGGLTQVAFDGCARALGRGHAVLEYRAPWGRPVAQWIPAWGEDGKAELARLRAGSRRTVRRGARRPHRRLQPKPVRVPQSGHQRHHGGDGPHLLSGRARLHGDQRLGAGAVGRKRLGAQIPAFQLPRIPRPRRLRHARRRRGAGAVPEGLPQLRPRRDGTTSPRAWGKKCLPTTTNCRCAPSGRSGTVASSARTHDGLDHATRSPAPKSKTSCSSKPIFSTSGACPNGLNSSPRTRPIPFRRRTCRRTHRRTRASSMSPTTVSG